MCAAWRAARSVLAPGGQALPVCWLLPHLGLCHPPGCCHRRCQRSGPRRAWLGHSSLGSKCPQGWSAQNGGSPASHTRGRQGNLCPLLYLHATAPAPIPVPCPPTPTRGCHRIPPAGPRGPALAVELLLLPGPGAPRPPSPGVSGAGAVGGQTLIMRFLAPRPSGSRPPTGSLAGPGRGGQVHAQFRAARLAACSQLWGLAERALPGLAAWAARHAGRLVTDR